MQHGLAELLRQGHRLAEKRKYRRRRNNEQLSFQNVRVSFSSAAFVLIWSLQLAGLHVAKKSRFWGSRFEAKNSNTGSSNAYRGKPLIFQAKIPYRVYSYVRPKA